MSSALSLLGVSVSGFLALTITMRILRRRVSRTGDQPAPRAFDLAELEQRRAAGKIRSEEFERLHVTILRQRHDEYQRNVDPPGFEVITLETRRT